MLPATYSRNLGENKCRETFHISVRWPRLSQEIEENIKFPNSLNQSETLKPTTLPDRPWETLGTDILKLMVQYYLVVIYEFLKCIEITGIIKKNHFHQISYSGCNF